MTTETDIGPVGAAHVPVMVAEVVEWLRPRPGARLVDATVGLGGHAAALLAAAPGAALLGLDRDPERARARRRRLARVRRPRRAPAGDASPSCRRCSREARLGRRRRACSSTSASAPSSSTTPARGFSFRADGPLDMRMDPAAPLTAAEIVNDWPERRARAHHRELRRGAARARRRARHRPRPAARHDRRSSRDVVARRPRPRATRASIPRRAPSRRSASP